MNNPPQRTRILRIALDVPRLARMVGQQDDLFDYRLAADASAVPGQRVLVPFGKQVVVGLIVELAQVSALSDDKLRDVLAVLDDITPLHADWFALARFAASYYQRSLGEVALPTLPASLRRAAGYKLSPVDGVGDPASSRYQSRSMHLLLKKLAQKPEVAKPASSKTFHLTDEQTQAVAAIRGVLDHQPKFQPMLLHGVTGSGKTEVYLHALAEVLRRGRQVLVLVPEINLTPALLEVFQGRFPEARIAMLHSGMADGGRALHWLLAHEGRADILLGTRMAVMASLPRLGLIVVDEEHDPSFKQQEGLRYSARDLAVVRAQQLQIPVILGSATPSLESWLQAKKGRYQKLVLTSRASAHAELPRIQLIGIERLPVEHGFSAALRSAIGQRLERGEQTLIFHNRRGYAPVLTCSGCGWVSDCKRCSVHTVFHKNDGRLHCHHCGWEVRVPRTCPDCGNADLSPLGRGTQRVEEALTGWFPQARIARIDRDSTRRKGSMQSALAAVHDGAVDILIGTQMVAKGHDFRNLTLVGVVDVDNALFSHDFRAAERLFATLMQVAGRAGRADKPGEVLIQTRYPQHPLFAALLGHDFPGFAQSQLQERRSTGLPPFTFQAVLRAEAKTLDAAISFLKDARLLAESLAETFIAAENSVTPAIILYDAVPMNLLRLANVERAQLVIESQSRRKLQDFLFAWLPVMRSTKTRVQWHVEVDPLEI